MKVTAEGILAVIKESIEDQEVVAKLKADVPLLQQGLDSIDMPVIAVATEKKFGVNLSDAQATKLKTVNDFVAFVNQKLS
ncbi:acyl carrier protein [Desulfobacter vibrioformis]|uniref:acyl carrier protein n=1 Tax=Desulfobacter vibrioformis TaxID=34031 RepID=UPI00068BF0F8|nr:acyl carrier protein [Desulfobacter vibrioformis]